MELVQARLVADSATVVPGRPILLGLHLKMAPGWHTYWEYSGDSGLPITLELELPEGFRATPLQWPLPLRLVEPGDLEVYAYKDEVLLMMRLFPPAELEASEVVIQGSSEWLVCEALCLPGRANVSLELRVGEQIESSNSELFARFQTELPQTLRGREEELLQVSWERKGDALFLEIRGPGEWSYDFFPLPPVDVVLGHPETLAGGEESAAIVRIPLRAAPTDLTSLPGVLVAEEKESGKRRGWRVN